MSVLLFSHSKTEVITVPSKQGAVKMEYFHVWKYLAPCPATVISQYLSVANTVAIIIIIPVSNTTSPPSSPTSSLHKPCTLLHPLDLLTHPGKAYSFSPGHCPAFACDAHLLSKCCRFSRPSSPWTPQRHLLAKPTSGAVPL